MGADPALRRFPLWVAHYTNGSPWVPAPYDSVFLHQWSSSGVVPGVVGRCDVNQILDHGTLDDLAGSSFTPQSLEEDLTPEQAKQLTKVAALADTLDVSWAGWKFDDGRPVNHLMEAFHFVLLRLEQAVARIDQDRSATASGWEFPDGRKVTSLVEFIDLTTRMQMDQTDRVLTALEKLGEKVGNPAPSAPAPTVDEIVAGLLERAKPAA